MVGCDNQGCGVGWDMLCSGGNGNAVSRAAIPLFGWILWIYHVSYMVGDNK